MSVSLARIFIPSAKNGGAYIKLTSASLKRDYGGDRHGWWSFVAGLIWVSTVSGCSDEAPVPSERSSS